MEHHPIARQILLACGVVGATWWVVVDVVGSLRYSGYSYVDYSISELSAQGAPTRLFMTIASGIPYFVLMSAFGIGVWATANARRAQRITGMLIVAEVVWGFLGGLLFPMAVRGVEGSMRNQTHPIYGVGMPVLFFAAMIFGSRVFGTRFRSFTYATIGVLLLFGLLTAMQGSKVPSGGPTPYMGLEERTNAYVSMLWLAVLSVGLLREQGIAIPRPPSADAATARGLRSNRRKLPVIRYARPLMSLTSQFSRSARSPGSVGDQSIRS